MEQLVKQINLSDLKSKSVFQSNYWAKVKSSWLSFAFSYKNFTILVLCKKLGIFNIAYVPFLSCELQAKEIEIFSKEVRKFLPKKTILIKYDLTYGENNISTPFVINKYSIQAKSTVRINLKEDIILSKRAQRNLKKTEEVEVYKSDFSEFNSWYKIYLETAKRDGFLPRDYKYIKNMLSIMDVDVSPNLYLSYYKNDVIGGIITIRNNYEEVFLFGATKEYKEGLSSGYRLQEYSIIEAKKAGLSYYDLFGISNGEDAHLESLDLFKTAFGGEIYSRCDTFDYDYSILAKLYRIIDNYRYKKARR